MGRRRSAEFSLTAAQVFFGRAHIRECGRLDEDQCDAPASVAEIFERRALTDAYYYFDAPDYLIVQLDRMGSYLRAP